MISFQSKTTFDIILIITNLCTFFFILIKGLIKIYNDKKINYLKVFCETYNHYDKGFILYLNIVSEKPININNIFLTLGKNKFNPVRQITESTIGIDYTHTSLDKTFPLFKNSFYLQPFIVSKIFIIFKDQELKNFKEISNEINLNIDLLFTIKKIKLKSLLQSSLPLKKYLKEYLNNELEDRFDDIDDKDRGILSDL
ncbi:hypothetical protein [Fusobacterium mortiferum]|uniref:hypothetical protein n=1 Tax=Fusobacterium mortiferum TaxID=850 RepID=UPI003563BC2D